MPEVERMLGLSRGAILGVVRSGVVKPARGARGAYRFAFTDLVLLRTARALAEADIPSRRITRSLRRLREQLPEELPLSGLRILADGDDVVVQDGTQRWQAETGQYLLALEALPSGKGSRGVSLSVAEGSPGPARAGGSTRPRLTHKGPQRRAREAGDWLERGSELEASDVAAAMRAYRNALRLDAGCEDAYVNLGRVLHQSGSLEQAERLYRLGLAKGVRHPLLYFNLAVLLEDADREEEAIAAYEESLAMDPQLADAHYNLSLVYEKLGKGQLALRHLREYRKLSV